MTTSNLNNIQSWAPNCRFGGALPAITGRFRTAGGTSNYRTIFTEISGAFYGDTSQAGRAGTTSEVENGYRYLNIDAQRSSSVYNRVDNLIIPSGTYSRPLIRYI